jgi:hypothetical protein
MPRVSGVFSGDGNAAQTVNYSAVENDFMFLIAVNKYGSAPSTPSGWTALSYTATVELGYANKIWYRRATASEPTSVTVTTSTGNHDVQLVVIKGVDTTTAFDVTATSRASAGANKGTAPAITPTNANTMILYLVVPNNVGMTPDPGLIKIARTGGSAGGKILSYYTYGQAGSTAVPAHDFTYDATGNKNPTMVTIALRDDGNARNKGYVYKNNPPATLVSLMGGGGGRTGHLTGTADINIASTITTLDGVTTSHRASTGPTAGFETGVGSFGYATSYSTQNCSIVCHSRTPSIDLETDIICFSSQGDVGAYKEYSTLGKHFCLGDGTNFRIWKTDALDTIPSGAEQAIPCVIEVDGGFEDTEVGTVSAGVLQALTHIAMGSSGQNTYISSSVGFLYKLNTMEIVGGSTDEPANMITAVDLARTSSLRTVSNQIRQSDTQFFCAHKVSVGNGSLDVYWDSEKHAMEWPAASSESDLKVQILAGADKFGFLIEATAGSTVKFANAVFNMGNFHRWELVSGTSTTATYTETGSQVINGTVVLQAIGRAIAGMTFTNCKEITKNSADLSGGNTFVNCNEAQWFSVSTEAAFEDLHNCTFKDNTTNAILITGNQSGSWDDPNLTVSGNTYDIEYSGTTDFSIQSANTLTVNNSSTGTLTIVTPTFDLVINTNVSSQIQIFTTNTQTVIDSATTATTLTYTHSSETVDIVVYAMDDTYIPFRQTATALSGNVTIDVVLVKSREVNTSHGLTYTTDASIYDNYSIITGITQANPAVVTYSGADVWTNGDIISIHDVVGMTEVNGKRYTIANLNTGANTFELSGVDSSAYTAYSSAGIALSGLSVPTFGVTGQNVFSLLLEEFRTRTALRNLPFKLEMDGSGSMFLVDGVEGEADSDIENLIDCGAGYVNLSGTQVAIWSGVNSIGTATGFQGEYQQIDGSTTTDARATGAFQELIKVYGDADHGNFDYRGHLVLKYQVNGYYQSRVDVLTTYGISSLTASLYVVAMQPTATGITTGDPAISITITDHTASPITVGGKSFDYEIVGGANSAEDILKEINYNLAQDATYQSKDPFNWPDMVIEVGGNYETQYGFVEGQDTTTTLHGIYVSQSSADHPGFSRFQSNDGSYYTPAVVASISITGMPTAGANIRLQIHNETAKSASAWQATTAYSNGDKVLRTTGVGTEQTAGLYFVATVSGTSGGTEPTWDTTVGNTTSDGTVTWTCYAILYYDADPGAASYADTYTDGEEFSSGDTYRIRFAELDGTTSFKTFETTAIAATSGFSVAVNEEADSVYAANAIDGSSTAVTNKFTADYTNDYIVMDANLDFKVTEAFAYYAYELTTSSGMYEFWGAVTAIDVANYRNNTSIVSIFFDESAGFVKQTDSARWFRDDDARPAIDPTTGGNGLEINWRNPAFAVATGSGVTAQDKTDIIDGVHNKTTEGSETFIQTTRIIRAGVAGKSTAPAAGGDGTYRYRDAADTKNRIDATVASNARTAVTTDGT